MDVLDLFVKIGIKDEASEEVDKVADNSIGKLAKAAKTAAKAIGGAFAIKKVVDFGKAAFDAYGEFEQLAGGARLAFGDAYDFIEQRSQQAFRNVQMSQSDYLEQVNGLAVGLRESLGGNQQAAAELADKIVTAEADIVAATGNTQENVQNAFNGIMKGNYTMLDNLQLGIKPTKEGMQEVIDKVNDWRVSQGQAGDLTIKSLADCQQAVVDYTEMMGYAGYAGKEGMDTIQGSLSAARSAWDNLVTEIGKPDADIGARVQDMFTAVFGENGEGGLANNVAKEVKIIAGNVARAMPEVAQTMFGKLRESARGVIERQLGSDAASLFDSFFDGLESIPERFSGVFESAFGFLDTAKSTAKDVFDSLIGAIEPTLPYLDKVADAAGPVISAALDTGGKAVEAFGKIFQSVAPMIEPLVHILSDVVVDHVFPAVKKVLDTAGKGFEKFGDVVSGMAEAIEEPVTRVATFVGDVFGGIMDVIGGVADFIGDPIGTITGAIDDIAYSAEDTEGRVSSSMEGVQGYVEGATKKSAEAINRYNKTPLKDKNAKANVKGNAIDGKAKKAIEDTDSATKKLKDKTVNVTVSQRGLNKNSIDAIRDAISRLKDKNITLTTHQNTVKTTTVREAPRARGGIRRHARGDILVADNPSYGVDVNRVKDIMGESGPEAIVPLTSHYGKDFAEMMGEAAAKFMGGGRPVVNIYMTYNAGDDAVQIVQDIANGLELVL